MVKRIYYILILFSIIISGQNPLTINILNKKIYYNGIVKVEIRNNSENTISFPLDKRGLRLFNKFSEKEHLLTEPKFLSLGVIINDKKGTKIGGVIIKNLTSLNKNGTNKNLTLNDYILNNRVNIPAKQSIFIEFSLKRDLSEVIFNPKKRKYFLCIVYEGKLIEELTHNYPYYEKNYNLNINISNLSFFLFRKNIYSNTIPIYFR